MPRSHLSADFVNGILGTPENDTTAILVSGIWLTWEQQGCIVFSGNCPVMDIIKKRVLYDEKIEGPETASGPARLCYVAPGGQPYPANLIIWSGYDNKLTRRMITKYAKEHELDCESPDGKHALLTPKLN